MSQSNHPWVSWEQIKIDPFNKSGKFQLKIGNLYYLYSSAGNNKFYDVAGRDILLPNGLIGLYLQKNNPSFKDVWELFFFINDKILIHSAWEFEKRYKTQFIELKCNEYNSSI